MVGGRGVRWMGVRRPAQANCFCASMLIPRESKPMCDWHHRSNGVVDPRHIREVDEPFFDPSLASVIARRRRYFHDLMLSESPIRCAARATGGEAIGDRGPQRHRHASFHAVKAPCPSSSTKCGFCSSTCRSLTCLHLMIRRSMKYSFHFARAGPPLRSCHQRPGWITFAVATITSS